MWIAMRRVTREQMRRVAALGIALFILGTAQAWGCPDSLPDGVLSCEKKSCASYPIERWGLRPSECFLIKYKDGSSLLYRENIVSEGSWIFEYYQRKGDRWLRFIRISFNSGKLCIEFSSYKRCFDAEIRFDAEGKPAQLCIKFPDNKEWSCIPFPSFGVDSSHVLSSALRQKIPQLAAMPAAQSAVLSEW
ncbi:MAG: hypothetical protein EBZ48_08575 [Proteobacteria bacterium]|nr:hypothetical protein [Pseudomonadota bacterium]